MAEPERPSLFWQDFGARWPEQVSIIAGHDNIEREEKPWEESHRDCSRSQKPE